MSKFIATSFLCALAAVTVQACAESTQRDQYSLGILQGGWWSDCQNPAVEFLIDGDEYSGDFSGKYKLKLIGDVLVFKDGLIDGHSFNVTHRPQSFLIMTATDGQLVLRPMPGNPYVGDWHLQSCKGMPPNNSF